jgi:hypothetical protein
LRAGVSGNNFTSHEVGARRRLAPTGHAVNQRRGAEGELWQPRFFDRVLRSLSRRAELWSAAASCRFPPLRACSPGFQPGEEFSASKLARTKAAASCRTPKLKVTASTGFSAGGVYSPRRTFHVCVPNFSRAVFTPSDPSPEPTCGQSGSMLNLTRASHRAARLTRALLAFL